jgi:DNA invertase Pin-like site-specific DNA recombinase
MAYETSHTSLLKVRAGVEKVSRNYVLQPRRKIEVVEVGYETLGERVTSKLIGYARVSTKQQDTERQIVDLLEAGVREDDLYVDHGVSGANATRPDLTRALRALQTGDHLVVTTLDRLGRSTTNMLTLVEELRRRGVGLRVLSLGGQHVDTSTPTGSMLFTVMAALAQMELDIKRERINDSVTKRRAAGKDLGGRSRSFTESQIRSAQRLIASGQPAAQVARDLSMSRATLYRRIADLSDDRPGQ